MWSLRILQAFHLSKFIRHPIAASRILPGNIMIGAQDSACAAFNTALNCDLNSAPILRTVSANWTERYAGLIFTGHADLGIDDCQVKFLFIGEILQGHQHVIDKDLGKIAFEGFLFHSSHPLLYTSNCPTK